MTNLEDSIRTSKRAGNLRAVSQALESLLIRAEQDNGLRVGTLTSYFSAEDWQQLSDIKLPAGGRSDTRDKNGIRARDRYLVEAYKLFLKYFDSGIHREVAITKACQEMLEQGHDLASPQNDAEYNLGEMIEGHRPNARKIAENIGIWRKPSKLRTR